jgi:hypothetical protein
MHYLANDRSWPFSASVGASLSVCFWGMQGRVCYQYEATALCRNYPVSSIFGLTAVKMQPQKLPLALHKFPGKFT